MKNKMQLYNHQKRLLEKNPKRILLSWSCGLGKSLASIELILKHTKNFLVITPKGLKKKWERDLQEHPVAKEHKWKVITKEEFRRDYEKIGHWGGVIIDESHNFASMKSQLSKRLINWLKKNQISVRILCTATPYLSSPLNILRLAQILGYDWNYIEFINRFFFYVPMGARQIPMVKKGIEPEIARLVQKIGDVVKLEDCADVPEQIHEVEYFALNSVQKKMIAKIEAEETNPLVKFGKIHQIEQGTLKGGETYHDVMTDIDKNERIFQLAEENKKIAVFCRYNLQIDYLKKKLEEADKTVFVLRGDTPDRDKVVQDVESSNECVVLINSACSEGYELPSIGVIIYASNSFSYKDLTQSQGRFLRINNLKHNTFIYLLTEKGMDEDVYNSLMKKMDFDLHIYSKNK